MANPNAFLLNDTLMNIIRHDIATTRIVPVLTGGPGFGKTSCLEDLAESFDTKIFKMQINSYNEKGDLLGVRVVPKEDGTGFVQVYIPNEVIVAANEYAEEHPDKLVFVALEEYNRAEPDVTSAAMTMPTERKCGTTEIAPNIRFLATGNDKGNVTEIDGASATRFAHYPVYPDLTTFLEVTKGSLNPLVKRTLQRNPELIVSLPEIAEDDNSMFSVAFGDDERENLPHANPRTIEGMSNWLNSITNDATDTTFLKELFDTPAHNDNDSTLLEKSIIAHTGDTAFSKALYAEIVKMLTPSQNQTPSSAAMPPRPRAMDALVGANTRNEVNSILARMDADELDEVILYSMTQNHPDIINGVLPMALDAYPKQYMDINSTVQLVNLFTEGLVTDDAFDVVAAATGGVGESIYQYLSATKSNK